MSNDYTQRKNTQVLDNPLWIGRYFIFFVFFLIPIGGCGGGYSAGISVGGPDTALRGEVIYLKVSIHFWPAESWASTKIKLRVKHKEKGINIQPEESEVLLDNSGQGEVTLIIQVNKEAQIGKKEIIISAIPPQKNSINHPIKIIVK